MKNKEKFAKEILDIVCKGNNVALDISTGSLYACEDFSCGKCYFHPDNYPNGTASCRENFAHWANSEYKEKKEFSEADKDFVRVFDKLNWFARDGAGNLYMFHRKPYKGEVNWRSKDGESAVMLECECMYQETSATFKSLSWEDDEPTSREEILGDKE